MKLLISQTLIWEKKLCTAVWDVKGSYPEPPDAKHTPVGNSLSSRFGSKYAGRNSLMPNSSTDHTVKEQKETNLRKIQDFSLVITLSIILKFSKLNPLAQIKLKQLINVDIKKIKTHQCLNLDK